MWLQKTILLQPRQRGVHSITKEIIQKLPELGIIKIGILHIFISHTSASLALNEDADPDVRHDLEYWLDDLVRENQACFKHTAEGPDDMPAHIKSVVTGSFLQLPVTNGSLALGTWQGIYLCEHRNHSFGRNLVLTLNGEPRE